MRVEQTYSLDIYPEPVLRQAIKDYHDICHIEATIKDGSMVCCFSHGKIDETTIMHEFSNYLIELLNSRRSE